MKLFAIFLFVGLFVSLGLRAASGPPAPERPSKQVEQPQPKAQGLLIDLGNENCPVMGGAVDGKTYGEWNNLRVGYCCPGCDGRFQKNAEQLLEDAGVEWRDAARAVEEYRAAPPEHKAHKLAAIRKRWTVVREDSR